MRVSIISIDKMLNLSHYNATGSESVVKQRGMLNADCSVSQQVSRRQRAAVQRQTAVTAYAQYCDSMLLLLFAEIVRGPI